MRTALGLSFLLAFGAHAQQGQPNIEAGKAKVAEVCSACHGMNGVSVSDAIPNLAGQRALYIENQLKAFKDGVRKNPSPANPTAIMNAMASQLSAAQITDVAAYFASLPGAQPGQAKSAQLPNIAKTNLTFPDNYKSTFVKYHTINFPATKQVRYYYANRAAIDAAKAGKPLPDGSYLLAEVYAAKLDADGKPVTRSEEHTSELQSQFHLVCRLLLEKKNTTVDYHQHNHAHDEHQVTCVSYLLRHPHPPHYLDSRGHQCHLYDAHTLHRQH